MSTFVEPVKAFISYSNKDRAYCDQLVASLAPLEAEHLLTVWFDHRIGNGGSITGDIEAALAEAQLILLLVTQNFVQSEWTAREVRRAMNSPGSSPTIIPIIFEPCDWRSTPIGDLKALPLFGKAVSDLDDRNQAMVFITEGVREAANRSRCSPDPDLAIFRPRDLREMIANISQALAVLERLYAGQLGGPPPNVRIDMERLAAQRAHYDKELRCRGELR